MASSQPSNPNRHVQDVTPDHMHMVVPGLYLGNAFAARNEPHLRSCGITHILSVTRDDYPPDQDLVRMTVPVDDWPDEDLLEHFTKTNAFISQALLGGGALVHCLQGVSRSATVVAAYLMATRSLSADEALDFLRARRPIINPNAGFARQLKIYGSSHCDMESNEGKAQYRIWKEERDAAYAEKVKQLEQL